MIKIRWSDGNIQEVYFTFYFELNIKLQKVANGRTWKICSAYAAEPTLPPIE
jgi:hypothetical protein